MGSRQIVDVWQFIWPTTHGRQSQIQNVLNARGFLSKGSIHQMIRLSTPNAGYANQGYE